MNGSSTYASSHRSPLRPIQTGSFLLATTLRTSHFHQAHSVHHFNMTDIDTATSKALGIPEIRSGILPYLGSQCHAVSLASRGFYLSCLDNPRLIKDFALTDEEISRHDLPKDADWEQMKAAIRSVGCFVRDRLWDMRAPPRPLADLTAEVSTRAYFRFEFSSGVESTEWHRGQQAQLKKYV